MKTVIAVLATSTFYATLRYNVFKGVPWGEWPIYTVNKALSLAGLALFALYVVGRVRGRVEAASGMLTAGWRLMLLHVALSLAILSPAYFPKFFDGVKLTGAAGLSVLLGTLSVVGFHTLSRDPRHMAEWRWVARVGALCFLVGLHTALLGYAGWFEPSTWPGYLPPITLIASAMAAVALVAALRPRRKGPDSQ